MKYCKDCKHHRVWHHQYCNAKNSVDPNMRNSMSTLCEDQREYGWILSRLVGTCGREGRFYESKGTTP